MPPCGAKTAKQRAQKFERPEPEQGPGEEAVDEQLESSDKDTANQDSAPLGGAGKRRDNADTTSYILTVHSCKLYVEHMEVPGQLFEADRNRRACSHTSSALL